MRIITFDIETKNIFQDVGSNDPVDLDISVVCIHDSLDDSYKSFLEGDLSKLWPIIEHADALVTWNGDHFDIPLLNKYYPGDLTKIKSLDLMREVQLKLGRRLKLDTVAEATLGVKKSGHGLEAVEWWKTGEIEKIIKYCIDDVKITRQIYDYALQHKHLKYRDAGALKEIKLDTSKWGELEPVSMTYTLPF
ncbi:MAG TPA: ribonuclease H-like domain-containing protein [Candidatus Paceibacterota bacterium]|jgi:DEAD/DEAH box helicase domain-containing protein|nr:ribonuclease H-like domain-containing protein [Candidatus Paceibacterota bacterium]